MELALEFGMPFERLKRSMTERELHAWGRYSRARLLPTRRLEMYLAQIACWSARAAGVKDTNINDYLIEFESDQGEREPVVVDVQAIKDAVAFRPRYSKKPKG